MKPAEKHPLQILKLRLLVGFLGEKRQDKWWDCGFFAETGLAFLQITFPRTAVEAALRSTSHAARLQHDSTIGRVGGFHLFRLPAQKDDIIESLVSGIRKLDVPKLIASREAALTELSSMAATKLTSPQGPVQVGVENTIFSASAVSEMAAHYYSAFTGGFQCVPYFAASTHAR